MMDEASSFVVSAGSPTYPAATDGVVAESVREEVMRLLPESKGQLGLVAACLRDGITDRAAIVEAGAAANGGAVGNILTAIRALKDGQVPDHAPTVAKLAASSARSFFKQHRHELSEPAQRHVLAVIENLTEAAGDKAAQAQEDAQLQEKGDELEEVLAANGGVYVFTYPHYLRYPTVDGTSRTLLKVGMTARDAKSRVREQARQTAVPEDPLLLRVYQHPTRSPRDVERDFHDLLDAADHDRSNSKAGGKEWFETSLTYLDVIAQKLGLAVMGVYETE